MPSFDEKLIMTVGRDAFKKDEPMCNHTTFRIGGSADYFIMPGSKEELTRVLTLLEESGVPSFIMGNGSNLLVSDDGYRGAIIQLFRNMSHISVEDDIIHAEAGALLAGISAQAVKESLGGMEFASGIPGTLGGAVFMNAGAYGGEIKDILQSVTVLDKNTVLTIPVSDMRMGYRTSAVKEKGYIVLGADLHLSHADVKVIQEKTDDFKNRRTEKQPLDLPSAGSTFKRPDGNFAGKLIMEAGLKGARIGGAQVSKKHCGFIVNTDHASAADVRALIEKVQADVYEKSGVRLEPEVRFLGQF